MGSFPWVWPFFHHDTLVQSLETVNYTKYQSCYPRFKGCQFEIIENKIRFYYIAVKEAYRSLCIFMVPAPGFLTESVGLWL